MPQDLTPKIISLADRPRMEPGGVAVPETRLQFMIGRFGPFEKAFDHQPTRIEIEAALAERRAQLEGLV